MELLKNLENGDKRTQTIIWCTLFTGLVLVALIGHFAFGLHIVLK